MTHSKKKFVSLDQNHLKFITTKEYQVKNRMLITVRNMTNTFNIVSKTCQINKENKKKKNNVNI